MTIGKYLVTYTTEWDVHGKHSLKPSIYLSIYPLLRVFTAISSTCKSYLMHSANQILSDLYTGITLKDPELYKMLFIGWCFYINKQLVNRYVSLTKSAPIFRAKLDDR
jgi:hypothetical protein